MCHSVTSKLLNPIKITLIKNLGTLARICGVIFRELTPRSLSSLLSSFIKMADSFRHTTHKGAFDPQASSATQGTHRLGIFWGTASQPKDAGSWARAPSQVHSAM